MTKEEIEAIKNQAIRRGFDARTREAMNQAAYAARIGDGPLIVGRVREDIDKAIGLLRDASEMLTEIEKLDAEK